MVKNTAPNFTIESLLDDLEQFRWIDTLKAEFKEIDAAKQAIDKIKSLNLPPKTESISTEALAQTIQKNAEIINNKVSNLVARIHDKVSWALANNLLKRSTNYHGESRGSNWYSW